MKSDMFFPILAFVTFVAICVVLAATGTFSSMYFWWVSLSLGRKLFLSAILAIISLILERKTNDWFGEWGLGTLRMYTPYSRIFKLSFFLNVIAFIVVAILAIWNKI